MRFWLPGILATVQSAHGSDLLAQSCALPLSEVMLMVPVVAMWVSVGIDLL